MLFFFGIFSRRLLAQNFFFFSVSHVHAFDDSATAFKFTLILTLTFFFLDFYYNSYICVYHVMIASFSLSMLLVVYQIFEAHYVYG